jgi:hypothetical protein
MESQVQPTRFARSVSQAALPTRSALASDTLGRPARIQSWGADFDASVKYGQPMKTNTVSVVGNSLLQGGASHPHCFASGCSGVSAHPRWHRPWPNPSVKGTSCGKPQAAPYLER